MGKISLKSFSCFNVLFTEYVLIFFSHIFPHPHTRMTMKFQKNPEIILGGPHINPHTVRFSKQLFLNSSSVWKYKPTLKIRGLKDLFHLSNLLLDVLGLCQHGQSLLCGIIMPYIVYHANEKRKKEISSPDIQ